MAMKFLDPDDPFFAKTWVRVVTVGLQDPLWGILFLAAGAYAGWMLFFKRKSDS
jgi:hypothetical protein